MQFLESVMEYLSKTTIHGLSYFGDRQRHWVERSFWIITFIVSTIGCIFLINKTYLKWEHSPLIISQDDKFTPVSEVPFPAVTICPTTKIANLDVDLARTFEVLSDFFWNKKKGTMLDLTSEELTLSDAEKNELNITDEEIRMIKAAAHICPMIFFDEMQVESVHSDLKNSEVEELLKTSRPPFRDTVRLQMFKGIEQQNIFPWVLTEEGICYTFNSQGNFQIFKQETIASEFRPFELDDSGFDWNAEDGYKLNQSIPLQAFKSAATDGLQLNMLQLAVNSPHTCPYEFRRLKVIVHPPGEFPTNLQNFLYIPLSHEVNVAVKPVMMTTTADLKGYSTNIRQCYFNGERNLKFFKSYTQINCEHECFTNFTRLTCGCAKLLMPRDNSTLLCGFDKFWCLFSSDLYFRVTSIDGFEKHRQDFQRRFNLTSGDLKLIETPCECLPSCASLEYELSITESESTYDSAGDERSSIVRVYFKTSSFMKLKRSELYGWGDFIANCGGLLGLFMGVSILSIIEIIYYTTLRLACNLNKSRVTDKVTIIEPSSNDLESRIVVEPEVIDWQKF